MVNNQSFQGEYVEKDILIYRVRVVANDNYSLPVKIFIEPVTIFCKRPGPSCLKAG